MNKDMIINHLKQTFMITFTFCSDLILQIPNISIITKVSLLITIYLSALRSGGCINFFFKNLMVPRVKTTIYIHWQAIYFFWCLKNVTSTVTVKIVP